MKYILDGTKPVPCEDAIAWARWFERADRRVRETTVDGAYISTVFLGIDHAFSGSKTVPILFETMVFGGVEDGKQWRCSTWEQAIDQHYGAVTLVRDSRSLSSALSSMMMAEVKPERKEPTFEIPARHIDI